MAKGIQSSSKDDRSSTKIVACSCKNDYQDKRYGQGKRVANLSRKNSTYKCTVCKASH